MIEQNTLKTIEETISNSTGIFWYSFEDKDMYQLFADMGNGFHPMQILKAPKHSEEYAEYWPEYWDNKLIVNAKTWLEFLLKENKELKERLK